MQQSLASLGLQLSTAPAHTCAELLSLSLCSAWQHRLPLPCHTQLQENSCAEFSWSPELSWRAFSPGTGYGQSQELPAWVLWLLWLDSPSHLSLPHTYSICPPFSILSSSPLPVITSWQNLPGSPFQQSWKSSLASTTKERASDNFLPGQLLVFLSFPLPVQKKTQVIRAYSSDLANLNCPRPCS